MVLTTVWLTCGSHIDQIFNDHNQVNHFSFGINFYQIILRVRGNLFDTLKLVKDQIGCIGEVNHWRKLAIERLPGGKEE